MNTAYETIKYCCKNTITANTLIYFKENEIDWTGEMFKYKNNYYFFQDCKDNDTEVEYKNMLNKSKEHNRLSDFIALIADCCGGFTEDVFQQFVEEGKCEDVNEDRFFDLFEQAKMELIREALA